MNSTDKLELHVTEETDGSAVISLPEGQTPPNQENLNEPDNNPHDGFRRANESQDHGDDDEDRRNDRVDPEREAIRSARREERTLKKQLNKARQVESNHLINQLRRQNDEMARRLADLEHRSVSADRHRIDREIQESQNRLNYAKMAIQRATENADGAALAEANEMWYEARRQVETLEARKAVAAKPAPQEAPKVDPVMVREANKWRARNSWFDASSNDPDSQIAVSIDESLLNEGWDPKTPDYWDELDNRLTKYLPHRYNEDTNDRPPPKRYKSVNTGSGREGSQSAGYQSNGDYVLSPERVRALKESGRWENLSERKKMIQKYIDYDRAQERNRS